LLKRSLTGRPSHAPQPLAVPSLPTIKRLEAGVGPLATKVVTINKLQRALELAGVEFTNGGQPGVRLAKVGDDGLKNLET
jgi:hypothetical protein